MMKFIIIVAILVSAAAAAELLFRGRPEWDSDWKQFKERHRKNYSHPVHESSRRKNWEKTRARIALHNQQAQNGDHTFLMADNHLSDLHDEEFEALNGAKVPAHASREADDAFPVADRQAASIDLRGSSCMPPIENQGQCGSCWAFSASTPLGYALCVKYGNNVKLSLSQQQLVDCSSAYGNKGCSGGWYVSAWDYVKAAPGQALLSSYPYLAANGTCSYSSSKSAGTVTGSAYVKGETAIMSAISNRGAVAAALHVVATFKTYSSGIYSDTTCSSDGSTVNHGVVLVGYGSLNGENYWILRNSWGTGWGMQGYAHVKRGVNMCNIESWAAYPIV